MYVLCSNPPRYLSIEPEFGWFWLNDVKLFKGIKYKETTESKLISNKGILYYFFNIKEFYDDFYKSGWKIGFLKSVFKVNMPYYNVYNYIKNKE